MKNHQLITSDLSSRVAESYRVLRTNIQFSSLDKPVKTILITSTAPAEGKSTTAANLAIAFAQTGSKVLIIDGDLRRPSQHKVFKTSNPLGLTNLLMQNVATQIAVRDVGVPNLKVVSSGPIPPNPSEIIGSGRMRDLLDSFKKDFDIIIIDGPPTLAVTDSAILSSMVDGVILVVAVGEVSKEMANKAKAQLASVKANILGVVLNGVEGDSQDDYYYYYYGSRRTKS
ncbi:MAG: CpsD/CapB family tyrosine-protein kinase [Firmicutes bacterium]|nr:CpsD/CapB family tyrosine-protein kinase [Dethiobacter sp.]MBS3888394.1 CpsD/CapB family tyrosine-protein kinase [Bacillota bacterium]